MTEHPCDYQELRFTPRELEVLGGLVRGDLQVDIAERLRISERFVERLVAQIKKKLGDAPTSAVAVGRAVKLGLVDPFDTEY
ncbi:MAG: helix-turn-helix transcriptional regulator [Pelolinea sp.]|nr:helix-turn-helix transcriptional regulator [Pelolinea sp.]